MFRLTIIFSILLSLHVLFSGCDLKVLSSDEQKNNIDEQPTSVAAQLLVVQYGNEALGNQQTLVLLDDGELSLQEMNPVVSVTTTRLSQTQTSQIVELFVDQGFFEIENGPLDFASVSEPVYSVDFYHDGEHNQVKGLESANPEPVQAIIDEVNLLIGQAREAAPKISLSVDRSDIVTGEKVELRLTITNSSSHLMRLNFSSSRLFDFMVRPVAAQNQSSDAPAEGNWQWSEDRYYSQVTSQIELEPGISRSYAVNWDGRDNNGVQLAGQFAIRAEVTSTPGGVSPEEVVNITTP